MFTKRAIDYYRKGYIWLSLQLVFFLLLSVSLYFINPKSLNSLRLEGLVVLYLGFYYGYWTRKGMFPGPPDEQLSFYGAFKNFGLNVPDFLIGILFMKQLASSLRVPLRALPFLLATIMCLYVLGQLFYLAYARMRRFESEMVGSYDEPERSEPEADQDFRFDE